MIITWENENFFKFRKFDDKDLIDFIENLNEIYYNMDINSDDIKVIIDGEEIPKKTWMKFYIH